MTVTLIIDNTDYNIYALILIPSPPTFIILLYAESFLCHVKAELGNEAIEYDIPSVFVIICVIHPSLGGHDVCHLLQ